MIAFAGLPDWAENTAEGKVLNELACTTFISVLTVPALSRTRETSWRIDADARSTDLSDEIIYDVSPAEVGEFEVCFGVQDTPVGEGVLGEEEMEAELAARQFPLE